MNVSGLSASLDGKELSILNRAQFYFKNNGSTSIHLGEIINNISIKFNKPVNFHEIKIYSTNKHNAIQNLNMTTSELSFAFNFLEKKDFIRADIYYESGNEMGGTISGKIMNQPELSQKFSVTDFRYKFEADSKYYNRLYNLMPIIFMFIMLVDAVLICSILHLNLNDLSALNKFMNTKKISIEQLATFICLLPIPIHAFFQTKGLLWIIIPFYMTIEKIKTWEEKARWRSKKNIRIFNIMTY